MVDISMCNMKALCFPFFLWEPDILVELIYYFLLLNILIMRYFWQQVFTLNCLGMMADWSYKNMNIGFHLKECWNYG